MGRGHAEKMDETEACLPTEAKRTEITTAYKTVLEKAALVLASTPPIDLLALKRSEIYLDMKESLEVIEKEMEIKKRAHERLLEKWQSRWDLEASDRWTHMLIPKLRMWLDRTHGQMGFYLTQVMTGHGKFNVYLKHFKYLKSAYEGGPKKNGNFVITSLFLNIFTPNFYHLQSILP